MSVALDDQGVHVTESTPGAVCPKTLLVPYLRDRGDGRATQLAIEPAAQQTVVRFTLGEEVVRLTLDAVTLNPIDLPHGYENRRGLCGLLRLDLAEPTERVTHHWAIEK